MRFAATRRHCLPLAVGIVLLVLVGARHDLLSSEKDAVESGPLPVVKRMDANRDGVLHPDEIPPGAESFVARVAREAGFEAGRPIALHSLSKKWKPPQRDEAAAGANSRPIDQKSARRYAASLIALYDHDGSGSLDRDESAALAGKWHRADRNADGWLNETELASELYSYRRHPAGERSWRYGDYNPLTDRSRSNQKRRLRFRSPRERLPAGIPAWFADRDADGDGQVKMSEYADRWTKEKLADFSNLDLNRDGIITPREVMSGGSSDE